MVYPKRWLEVPTPNDVMLEERHRLTWDALVLSSATTLGMLAVLQRELLRDAQRIELLRAA